MREGIEIFKIEKGFAGNKNNRFPNRSIMHKVKFGADQVTIELDESRIIFNFKHINSFQSSFRDDTPYVEIQAIINAQFGVDLQIAFSGQEAFDFLEKYQAWADQRNLG